MESAVSKPAEGEKHLFIDEIHQYHVCQHESCKLNRDFDRLLKKYGGYELNRKISRRELYRLYDRRWPYDSTTKAIDLEEVKDTLGESDGSFDQLVASEAVEAFKTLLTPRQLEVLEHSLTGLKPREIAELHGDIESGKWRWHKHIVKKKAQEWFDVE